MLSTKINPIFLVILHNKIEKLMQTQPNTLNNYFWRMFGRWLVRYPTKNGYVCCSFTYLFYIYKENI
jgi:hypothetical protein